MPLPNEYHGRVMNDDKTTSRPHLLIVTGPLRDRLYERFSQLYSGVSDVKVVKDRRRGERRQTLRPHQVDRRRSDRRRGRPDWVFPPEAL